MTTEGERLAALEERVRALADQAHRDHLAIMERLDGGHDVPFERSIRGRIHHLEADAAAATAASRALAEAQRERRQAQAARDDAEEQSSARFWRRAAVVVAFVAVVLPYVFPHGGLVG